MKINVITYFPDPCRVEAELTDGWIDFQYSPFTRVYSGDVVNSGSSIRYHCGDEFDLVGRDSNTCLNGVWEHEPPRCAVTCFLNLLLEGVLNLGYSCHLNGNEIPCSNVTKTATTVRFYCPTAGTANPATDFQVFSCESDGQWSGKPRSCESSCEKESTPREVLIYDGDNTERCRGKILTPRSILVSAFCFWNTTTDRTDVLSAYRVVVAGQAATNLPNLTTYNVHRLLFDKLTFLEYGYYDYTKLGVAMLKRPIEYNGQLIPICLYAGSAYEKVLRYADGKTREYGEVPDIVVYTMGNTSVVHDVRTSYKIYESWVVSRMRKVEGTGNRYYCSNGIWDNEPARCIPTCSLNVLDDIRLFEYNLVPNGTHIPGSSYANVGSRVQISCSGAGPDDSAINNQEIVCGSNNQWSENPNSCVSSCGNNGVPWRVLIFNGSRQRKCRGKILTPKIILASPYCFWDKLTDKLDDISAYRTVVTDADQTKEAEIEKSYEIDYVRYEESFTAIKPDGGVEVYPIGLAILKQPITFNGQLIPICLYPANNYDKVLRYRQCEYLPDFQTSVYDVNSSGGVQELILLFSINNYKNWVIPQIRSIEENAKR